MNKCALLVKCYQQRNILDKNLFQCNSVHHKPIQTGLGLNPGLHTEGFILDSIKLA